MEILERLDAAGLLEMLVTLGLLIATVGVAAGLTRLKGTTLVTAGYWALLTIILWNFFWLVWALESNLKVRAAAPTNFTWYVVAVVSCCPSIAVLGARRPGARVWTAFVLIPLVLVLMWPALASVQAARGMVSLEAPALIGFLVVLIMGAGNYFGTRFTLPACLYVLATVMVLAPMSEFTRQTFLGRSPWIALEVASLLVVTAVCVAWHRARQPGLLGTGFDRVWYDFHNAYGLVWGKRVMDRLNEAARYEKWCAHLEWQGFVWNASATTAEQTHTRERIEHNLRWLLKRFVDSDWIDRRLAESNASPESHSKPACQ